MACRPFTEHSTAFRGPGHVIEEVTCRGCEEFGMGFIEHVSPLKLMELASVIANFVTDNLIFKTKKDKVYIKEFDLGLWHIVLEKQGNCFITKTYYKDCQQVIEYGYGYNKMDSPKYGLHEGALKERVYEELTIEERNQRFPEKGETFTSKL